MLAQEDPGEDDRQCRVGGRERTYYGDRSERDGLEIEDPRGAVEQVRQHADRQKSSSGWIPERRVLLGQEEAEVDDRGGQYVIKAIAPRGDLSDPLLHE